MAARRAAKPTEADKLRHQCNIFRREMHSLYEVCARAAHAACRRLQPMQQERPSLLASPPPPPPLPQVLLWRALEWPAQSLQWQPASWVPPQPLRDAQEAASEQAAQAVLERLAGLPEDVQAHLPGPLDFQYLVLGTSTDGLEDAHVVLCRVTLPGQLPDGFDPARQAVALGHYDITPVMVSAAGSWQSNCAAACGQQQWHVACTSPHATPACSVQRAARSNAARSMTSPTPHCCWRL